MLIYTRRALKQVERVNALEWNHLLLHLDHEWAIYLLASFSLSKTMFGPLSMILISASILAQFIFQL